MTTGSQDVDTDPNTVPLAGTPTASDRPDAGGAIVPGEVMAAPGAITLNEGREARVMVVANTGDRPVQVGSHYHFAETNGALDFDRKAARGHRLDIPSGTAVRFEPGQRREVRLIAYGGAGLVRGFNGGTGPGSQSSAE